MAVFRASVGHMIHIDLYIILYDNGEPSRASFRPDLELCGLDAWRQEKFTTPRAVVSLRFFNCFRLLLEKADNENELKIYVETLAFKQPASDVDAHEEYFYKQVDE